MPRLHNPVLIDSETILQQGAEALAALDPVMAALYANGAKPALRWREAGFSGLCWIVTGQQLSVSAAGAIWGRVCGHLGAVTPHALLTTEEETLRGLGMSRGKVKTLRAVAQAVTDGALPLESLHEHPADHALKLMTAVHGIGPWTAELYLMFCLGHGDIFPAGDLALQEAARLAYGLDSRPTPKELAVRAELWQPWRSVAARILWAYYRQVKFREGVVG